MRALDHPLRVSRTSVPPDQGDAGGRPLVQPRACRTPAAWAAGSVAATTATRCGRAERNGPRWALRRIGSMLTGIWSPDGSEMIRMGQNL